MPVDDSFAPERDGYTLTRIHHLHGHVIRIRIRRNCQSAESWAVADVLTPGLTWTQLAASPPATWHHKTPAESVTPAALNPIATALLTRALTILTAHTKS